MIRISFKAWAYPRRRGGTDNPANHQVTDWGLSPQARGNQGNKGNSPKGGGPIPAGAGEPPPHSRPVAIGRAYPRRRGGTGPRYRHLGDNRGLSPQARGNRTGWSQIDPGSGPIPAGAGEPSCSPPASAARWAYPRRRGGTHAAKFRIPLLTGLSPQARGNPAARGRAACRWGPIPAGAGEPSPRWSGCTGYSAYPRRRGGTAPARHTAARSVGLSPQARGNHALRDARLSAFGPIPAGAGEPRNIIVPNESRRAYPRRRGGTVLVLALHRLGGGLSPQARGNPRCPGHPVVRNGPIPAGAGEPGTWGELIGPNGAYPRRRGGTAATAATLTGAQGLSPQARGNLHQKQIPEDGIGPIPAGAGEPKGGSLAWSAVGAYPRRRGGTRSTMMRCPCRTGLSPQARGNRRWRLPWPPSPGPIPAGAGEPQALQVGKGLHGAYPRRRGGTYTLKSNEVTSRGLSPQARGNLLGGAWVVQSAGPIPAGAGEPVPSGV